MKILKNKLTYLIVFLTLVNGVLITAQISQAKVYWVGHSLISHTDYNTPGADNLINLMGTFATSQSKTYGFHQHTTPGAPIGYNWGGNAGAWAEISTVIEPLIDMSNTNYGTYDVMVLTEGIELSEIYYWWNSSFYARKFFNAALAANPATRLYIYESWHHYHASDDASRAQYGPIASFDWKQYMLDMRIQWEEIIDRTADPALTQFDPGYVYQGPGVDPGLGNNNLNVMIIPTGQVLVAVLDRLALDLASDDWSYDGGDLEPLDFFMNPLSNWPTDIVSVVNPGNPIDDIHASNVLAYLNALVHYAVVYQANPASLPLANSVPSNIADIFKEVVWDVVINDPRTGVSLVLPVTYVDEFRANLKDGNVELFWSVASEINNDYFEIERSARGLDWEVVTKVMSHSNGAFSYRVLDETPLEGTSFYRLKQVDQDGSYDFSNVQSIYFEYNTVSIFPNPASALLTIGSKTPIGYYSILNSQGEVILKSDKKKLNVSHLASGLYFLKFRNKLVKWIKE